MLSVIFVVLIVILSQSGPFWAWATPPTASTTANRTSRLVFFMARTISARRRPDGIGPPRRQEHTAPAAVAGAAVGRAEKAEGPLSRVGLQNPGSVLLSHRVAPTVPSALKSLTSVFG